MKQLNLEELKSVQFKPGVYLIYWYENDQPVIIHRFMDRDLEGLLYIGKSKNLNQRLKEFRRSFMNGTEDHVAGKKCFYNKLIKQHVPINSLYFEFEYNINHNSLEKELLNDYRFKYGEVPPLNG